jgi:superfamily II DNA or RNA helicase
MIANGYFKNFTEFRQRHCVYSRFSKYPKIDRYVDTAYLTSLRNKIMVSMPMKRKTKSHTEYIETKYDRVVYKEIMRTRMNPETGEPFMSAAELCLALRKVVNTDPSKVLALLDIWQEHRKCIVFYNFNYELDILEKVCEDAGITYAQWNGHKHENIPSGDEWMYLVQYTAGAEGWNCTLTDTIIFFSQNYSYKIMSQSSGRINRLNTEFIDLWYYILRSASSIDLGISRALKEKKDFNANGWLGV